MNFGLLAKFIFAAILLFSIKSIQACTDFRLQAKDGSILITRSMEFAQDLKSNLRSSTRGRAFNSKAPNGKAGLSWISKYGYLYIDGFDVDASFDGINETGLTFEYLYLPGETRYQTIADGQESKALSYILFGDWILGNFKTIDEVLQALAQINVVEEILPQLGSAILPAHASIYDATGRGIVVEFYNNKINVYDNIGIMTNSPKYDWHITNLNNYINLSPNNPAAISKGNMTFAATGQGSGAVGLPGDASPPSRFVKIAFMLNNVFEVENAPELLNLAQHIINNVDLPKGYVRSVENTSISTDITQWVVFKDVTKKILYYRTYNDLMLHAIEMKDIDFKQNAPLLKMSLMSFTKPANMTEKFLNSVAKG